MKQEDARPLGAGLSCVRYMMHYGLRNIGLDRPKGVLDCWFTRKFPTHASLPCSLQDHCYASWQVNFGRPILRRSCSRSS